MSEFSKIAGWLGLSPEAFGIIVWWCACFAGYLLSQLAGAHS